MLRLCLRIAGDVRDQIVKQALSAGRGPRHIYSVCERRKVKREDEGKEMERRKRWGGERPFYNIWMVTGIRGRAKQRRTAPGVST